MTTPITLEDIESKLHIARLQFQRTGSDADAEIVVTLATAREHMRVANARAWAAKALEAADADPSEEKESNVKALPQRLRAGR